MKRTYESHKKIHKKFFILFIAVLNPALLFLESNWRGRREFLIENGSAYFYTSNLGHESDVTAEKIFSSI